MTFNKRLMPQSLAFFIDNILRFLPIFALLKPGIKLISSDTCVILLPDIKMIEKAKQKQKQKKAALKATQKVTKKQKKVI